MISALQKLTPSVNVTYLPVRGIVGAAVGTRDSESDCIAAPSQAVAWRCVHMTVQKIPHGYEQIALFADADIVVTAHTGGLVNVGFVRPFGAVIEIAGYHSKPVAYDYLWGSARVHHLLIESLTPNISMSDKYWDPAKEELFNPTSPFHLNLADRELGGKHVHLFLPEPPKGILVDVEALKGAVKTAVALVSEDSSDDLPVGSWR